MNKIGDKVIFIGDNLAADIIWKLEYGEMYIISNLALDRKGDLFYSLTHKDGSNSCWYREEYFISLSEQRKFKLEKINENT
jgi:hypothetical protein